MRHSGIDVIGDVPWGTHFCQFYETRRDLIETLVPYFKEGLAANEYCMWVTSRPLETREAEAALQAAVPKLQDCIRAGQIEIVDYRDWYLRSGKFSSDEVLKAWVDKLRSARDRGFEGLRLTGNTFWLEAAGWEDFRRYEEAVNAVIGRHNMLAVCTYSLEKCGATEIMDVISNHEFALIKRRGRWEIIQSQAQKQMVESLRKSALTHSAILQTAQAGFWLADMEGRLLEANPAYCRMSGYSLEELLKMSICDLEASETPEDTLKHIQLVRRNGHHQFETTHRRKDGSVYDVEVLTSYLDIEGGRLVVFAGDISDRKKVEEELIRTRNHLENLLDYANAPILVWDPDFRITRFNRAFERLTGLRAEEAIGRPLAILFPEETRSGSLAHIKRTLAGERWEVEEIPILRTDGSVRTVLWNSANIYDEDGTTLRATIAQGQDITERKLAEQALQQRGRELQKLTETLEQRVEERTAELARANALLLAEITHSHMLGTAVGQVKEGMAITDAQGRIEYFNPAFEKTSGVGRAGLLGRLYYELLAKEDADGSLGDEPRKAVEGGEAWSGHILRKHKGGQAVELDIGITPIRDRSGNIIKSLVVERDVTQEVRLQQHLRQAQKMEALGTLAGGIAHDFNNILNPIFINTELLLMDAGLDPAARRDLEIVLKAAERGRDLVKQIISFSRQKEKERKPSKVGPVVKEALKFLRSSLPTTIEMRQGIEPESGFILADPSQIHQVVMNLCNNAAYAMQEKGGILDVSLREVDVDRETALGHPGLKPGPYLQLTVRDTGKGMTPEVMERAFDPFFTTKKHGQGAGLGLALVHGIVRDYGGAVKVDSEVEKGTTFDVYFPRVPTEAAGSEAAAEEMPKGTERILLVEDERTQAQSIRNMLRRLGYRVVVRTDAEQALAAFQKDPDGFDLIITDQIMPKLTGVQFAARLFEIRPGLPVVLCTGFSEQVDSDGARAMGIRGFLMKPFSIREMAGAIKNALGR
jgi:PAS domain S-box-containing protein